MIAHFNLTYDADIGMVESSLRGCNAQFEPSFVLDRLGVRLLEASAG
jgi:hypothetical protein